MTLLVPFHNEQTYNGLGPIGQPVKNVNGVSKLNGANSMNGAHSPVYIGISKQRRLDGHRTIPLSSWAPVCHPLVEPITAEVDAWFMGNWPFPNGKARQKFIAAGFSRVTCLYFPLAKDDRIAFACRLLAILFLIDDILEYMSLEDGKAYNEKLMPLARGEAQPDRTIPVEAMFYDLWASMREKDRHLADQVLEPTFVFMRAQTEKIRTEITELGQYLQYRERDVGKALLSALMRFAMDLHLTDEELAGMKEVEMNCAKHISIVNDIYSWEKELKQSQVALEEGSVLCSGVKVLSDSTGLDIEAAKTCLWALVREWELKHELLSSEPHVSSQCSEAQKLYLQGLEYQMSGNEIWSRTTPRYLVVD